MKAFAKRITTAPWFEYLIVGFILLNALILGLETSSGLMADFGSWLEFGNQAILAIFILEAALKIIAVAPRWKGYFGDGWNLFDFSVIVVALIPTTGPYATLARMARLLRVLRLVSALPELRLIVSTLVRSLPGMMNILLLMSIVFYIYAVAGYHLFHAHDPEHWRNLGISLLTLFRVATLEDWTDVMYIAMELSPWAWMFFVSFVVVGTFVVINLFIAVVLNGLELAKTERLEELRTPPTRDELLEELRRTQESLARLEARIEGSERR